MIGIGLIELPQELDPVHVLGDSSSDVMITVKPDSAICDGFRGLAVRSRYDNAIRAQSFLELRKQPGGRGETTDEPDSFNQASREGDLVPDGGDCGFY